MRRASSRPDGRGARGARGAVVAFATALSLFLITGLSYADDTSDATTPAPPLAGLPADGTPRVAWEARDDNDKPVAGLTFEVQGPRDESAPDDGGRWTEDGVKVTVEDNTGQAEYDGLDADPAPGVFVVAQLGDDLAVAEAATYRVAATDPDGVQDDGDTQWAEIEATASDDEDLAVVTVKPDPGSAADDASEADGSTGGSSDLPAGEAPNPDENVAGRSGLGADADDPLAGALRADGSLPEADEAPVMGFTPFSAPSDNYCTSGAVFSMDQSMWSNTHVRVLQLGGQPAGVITDPVGKMNWDYDGLAIATDGTASYTAFASGNGLWIYRLAANSTTSA